MKFGLALDFAHPTRTLDQQIDHYRGLLAIAEDYGFDSVTLGEGYPSEPSWGHVPSPLLVLAALASQTTLRLGTSVTLLPSWHPLKLAYDTAVLDQISGGRLILGVGVGGAALHRRFGRETAKLGDEIDDTLAALRALWAGEKGYQGKALSVQGGMGVRPIQPGGPELWVGGGLRRSAERAARWGDGWCASTNYPFETVARQSARYGEARQALGKPTGDGVVSINRLAVVAESETAARELAAPFAGRVLQRYARGGALGDDPNLGSQAPEELLRLFNSSHCLVGRPEDVATEVRRYRDAGVTQIQLRVSPDEMPIEGAARTVELFGQHVLPSFR